MSERQLLAERWRVIGKMLRERSPGLFEKLLDLFAASAVEVICEDGLDINETYTVG